MMSKAELSRIADISPLTITRIAELVHAEEDLRKAHDELELRVKKRTKELKAATSEVKRKEEELVKLKIYSEKINKELMETNQALSTLARNIDSEKKLLEKNTQYDYGRCFAGDNRTPK